MRPNQAPYLPQRPQAMPTKPAPAAPMWTPNPANHTTFSKFVVPSPEALGVSAQLSFSQPTASATSVDWGAIQARLERLGVLRYKKSDVSSQIVRVTITLPTSDPAQGQPVTAEAQSEAAAIAMALDAAEAWMQRK